MKYLSLIITVLLMHGWVKGKSQTNYFSSSHDTLIIKTKKCAGISIFPSTAGSIHFMDTSVLSDFKLKYPKGLNNIQVSYFVIDFKPWFYKTYKEGKYETAFFNLESKRMNLDTIYLPMPEIYDNSICVMLGKKGEKPIIIVDENNNKDFRDDSMRTIPEFDKHSIKNLIKCSYKIYDGSKYINDSTWINLGTSNYNNILWFVSNHLTASFFIDNEEYQIGIVDWQSHFTFDEPLLALTKSSKIYKDTLLMKELINRDEYLKLGDTYYQFNNISNNGNFVTFIKERNFETKTGTQVGMLAPEFKCITINGDTLNSTDLHKDKPLLIANISGCYPKAYDLLRKVTRSSSDSIYILWLEYEVNSDWHGRIADVEKEYNKKLYEKYRGTYSSYVCFLISKNCRIIDKFSLIHNGEVIDWGKKLKQIIERNE